LSLPDPGDVVDNRIEYAPAARARGELRVAVNGLKPEPEIVDAATEVVATSVPVAPKPLEIVKSTGCVTPLPRATMNSTLMMLSPELPPAVVTPKL
jgi:hypothetical protein